MDYNYHAHTYRCSHASGSEEEYVLRAVDGGIKKMGFSDHIPFIHEDGSEHTYRVPDSKCEDYILTIRSLREKYRGTIDIKVGFEMEYYPEHFDKMLNYAIKSGAEYLILGQHHTGRSFPDPIISTKLTTSEEHLREYTRNVVAAIRMGVFTYVAHPDILNFVGDSELYYCEMRKICEASKACDIPLEINFLGIRERRPYPNDTFWKIAGEIKSPVTFGFDSHDVFAACDTDSLVVAEDMVRRFGLNYIGEPKIIDISKRN